MNSECLETYKIAFSCTSIFKIFLGGMHQDSLACKRMQHRLRHPYAEHLSDFWLDPLLFSPSVALSPPTSLPFYLLAWTISIIEKVLPTFWSMKFPCPNSEVTSWYMALSGNNFIDSSLKLNTCFLGRRCKLLWKFHMSIHMWNTCKFAIFTCEDILSHMWSHVFHIYHSWNLSLVPISYVKSCMCKMEKCEAECYFSVLICVDVICSACRLCMEPLPSVWVILD